MRKNLLVVSFIVFVVLSCEKEPGNLTNLWGKWSWLYSQGGIAGMIYTPESKGYRQTLEFTGDSVFKIFRNDTLIRETRFHFIKSTSIFKRDSTFLIIYDDNPIAQSYDIKHSDKEPKPVKRKFDSAKKPGFNIVACELL